MLYYYCRNDAIAGALRGPEMAVLGEPRLDPRGALLWRFEGGSLAELREVVPSFSDIGSPAISCRFVVRAKTTEGAGSEVRLDWLGVGPSQPKNQAQSGPLTVDIDTVKVNAPLHSLEIHLEFSGDIRPSRDAVVAISMRGPRALTVGELRLSEGELLVPPFSQFEQSPEIGHRICSPTSVAMVLNYYGYPVAPVAVAELSYAASHDLYGVWPKNIWAASQLGVPGCLMHIESWETIEYLLRLDIPVIASIRYRRGELRGAAFSRDDGEMTGHLVVVRGSRGGEIVVNDPGARSVSDVARTYDRGEFSRVWFERSAMAYIILPPRFLQTR